MDTSCNTPPHYQDVRPSRLQPFNSSVIKKTLSLFERRKRSQESVKWGIINLFFFLLCYLRIIQTTFWYLLHKEHHYVVLFEFGLGAIFALNALSNLYNYFSPTLLKEHIALSPKQRVLLGVAKEDTAFHHNEEKTETTAVNKIGTPTPVLMPRRRGTNRTTPTGALIPDTSQSTSIYTPSPIGSSSPSSMMAYVSQSPPNSSSPKRSELILNRSPSTSPGGLESSPLSASPLSRFRGGHSSPTNLKSGSPDDAITDTSLLNKYLKDQEELDIKMKRAQLDTTPNSRQSFWTYGKPAYDFVPSPGAYQLASRSTQSTGSKDDDFSSSFIKFEETWKKLGVHPDDLDFWRENLRKWLAETVLDRLVQEINNINNKLVQIGCSELQVGNVSASSLRNVSLTKSQHVPSLKSVIPYLDLTANQEYLISRVQELSNGGCLRMFKWNSGGSYKGKPWDQDLPTDAQIILHLFCTYLDTHLPSNPRYQDGKSFSGLHFLKTPIKPSERKSDICIYQSRTHPPHFKVLHGEEVYDMPRGRNNLFHAILIFLYFVKIHNFGMLEHCRRQLMTVEFCPSAQIMAMVGCYEYDVFRTPVFCVLTDVSPANDFRRRMSIFVNWYTQEHRLMSQRVNLGLSGINILWVINKK